MAREGELLSMTRGPATASRRRRSSSSARLHTDTAENPQGRGRKRLLERPVFALVGQGMVVDAGNSHMSFCEVIVDLSNPHGARMGSLYRCARGPRRDSLA